MTDKELVKVTGGAISATLLNALSRTGTFILELGQIIGSVIKRATSGQSCSA